MALGKTLFFHDRLAQLTEGLASHSVDGATAARLLGPFLLHAHPRAALSPAEWETWGGWGGTCSVNTGAQVLGTPPPPPLRRGSWALCAGSALSWLGVGVTTGLPLSLRQQGEACTRPGALRAGGLSVVLSSPCLGLGCCWGAQARGGLLGLQDGTDARQLGARPWSGGWLPGGRPRPRCVLVWAEPCRGCGGGVASCWWVCLGAEPAVPPWPSAHSLALTAFLLCRCCQV